MTCESRVKMICINSFQKKINSKIKLTINNAKSTWNDIAFFFSLKFFFFDRIQLNPVYKRELTTLKLTNFIW